MANHCIDCPYCGEDMRAAKCDGRSCAEAQSARAGSVAICTNELRWNDGRLEQRWVGRGGVGDTEWRRVPGNY